MKNETFYVYMWLREDGSPYYVGKGHGSRALYKYSRVFNPPPRNRVIIQEFLTESDSLLAESFLVSYFGRKDTGTGVLRNRTDGGDGSRGLSFAAKSRIGNANRGNTYRLGVSHTEHTRKRLKQALKGNRNATGNRYWLGRKHSDESRQKMSDSIWQRRHISIL
jgi:hypothetical protein